jgi:hypothetical protein
MNNAPHVPRPTQPTGTQPAQERTHGRRRWRVGALVVLLVLLWTSLLLVAASIPHGAALEPAQRLRHAGAEFEVVAGAGAGIVGDRLLNIASVGSDHMAVQARTLTAPIEAGDFPVLRHRWHRFPQTLELSFMFRRADAPEDVHTITLPPAGRYPAYFDLGDVPAWRGRITEVGFAEYPTAQLVPADTAFRPFALVEMELWSPSWRGSLGALGTDWFAYRPWALMSISALGPDAPWPHKMSPVLVLAFGLFSSVLFAGVLLRRGRRWIGAALCIALGSGWLLLDLRWLAEFSGRTALTRELHAGQTWSERSAIVPDRELLDAAERVRDLLSRAQPDTRVLVAADTPYTTLRLDYHLLPVNAAPATALAHASPQALAAAPIWLVAWDATQWRYDEPSGILHGPATAFVASVLHEDAHLRVYRLDGAAR